MGFRSCCSEGWKKVKHQDLSTRTVQHTPRLWAPIYCLIGAILIAAGLFLFLQYKDYREVQVDYTEICLTESGVKCYDELKEINGTIVPDLPCECSFEINLDEDLEGNINFFYHLTRFYQNDKRYVKSRDEEQLTSKKNLFNDTLDNLCEPYFGQNDSRYEPPFFVPCGIIANSIFTDTFRLERIQTGSIPNEQIPVETVHGLVERAGFSIERRYLNPKGGLQVTMENKPERWTEKYYQDNFIDSKDNESGLQYPPFVLWMNTAAQPRFRKLWGYIAQGQKVAGFTGLPKGQYKVTINYTFPVHEHEGQKSIIISNGEGTGPSGSRIVWFSYAFIGLGSIYLLVAVFFVVLEYYVKNKKKKVKPFSRSNISLLPMQPVAS